MLLCIFQIRSSSIATYNLIHLSISFGCLQHTYTQGQAPFHFQRGKRTQHLATLNSIQYSCEINHGCNTTENYRAWPPEFLYAERIERGKRWRKKYCQTEWHNPRNSAVLDKILYPECHHKAPEQTVCFILNSYIPGNLSGLKNSFTVQKKSSKK